MNALLPTLCLSLFLSSASAQLFTLVDKDSKPIEFAHVLFYKDHSLVDGTYATTKGEVFSQSNFDKVVISHLSYNDTVMYRNDLSRTVVLSRNKAMLEVAIVTPKNDLSYSYIGEKTSWWSNSSYNIHNSIIGYRILMLFSADDNEERVMKSFIFHAKRKKNHSPIYVKVVFFENNDGEPGNQLAHQIITSVVKQKRNKIVLDLENENITLPAHGLFVGIEYIGTEAGLTQSESDLNDREQYLELVMNYVKESKVDATFYQSSLIKNSNQWRPNPDYFKHDNHVFVPVFGIEVFD